MIVSGVASGCSAMQPVGGFRRHGQNQLKIFAIGKRMFKRRLAVSQPLGPPQRSESYRDRELLRSRWLRKVAIDRATIRR